MSDFDSSPRVAVVTGGASGMGAASARTLAAEGYAVMIVDRNGELAEQTATEIGAETRIGDISDSAFCNATIDETITNLGRVDVLVNAAGVIVRAAGEATTDDEWRRVMDVNVSGTFFMCRAAITAMKVNGGGAIVNFGSIWGDLGATGVAAYCASKGAVHNLTRALALDHATDNIRVNAVCPGEVNTPMLSSERSSPVDAELLAALASTVPTNRLADPQEVANVVAFLASDKASYMTGALVTVDAGYSAR